jgi:hypothetical protein
MIMMMMIFEGSGSFNMAGKRKRNWLLETSLASLGGTASHANGDQNVAGLRPPENRHFNSASITWPARKRMPSV